MPRFIVEWREIYNVTVEVEAENAEEAREKVRLRDYPGWASFEFNRDDVRFGYEATEVTKEPEDELRSPL